MTNYSKKFFSFLGAFFMLSVLMLSCESDADNLGLQFFNENAAQGTEVGYDVIAYNTYLNDTLQNQVNDTLRSDALKIPQVAIGAFDESVFGMQKSSYVSQVRMIAYNPKFGANAKLDSVVLQIKPLYHGDSVTTVTKDDYIYTGNIPAKLVTNTYPAKKYGKTKINGKTVMNIRVEEVTEFLNSINTKYYSNKNVNTGSTLGTYAFNGDVKSIKITKDTDNSELLSREAGIRIKLDTTFFKNKILAKEGSQELKDAASFIRYFRGVKISVDENDGFIFSFNPHELNLVMYYKYDKTENNVTTRTPATLNFDLGTANSRFAQIQYNRTNATLFNNELATMDTINGESKLFMQGMGGPSAGIKIPDATIQNLRTMYNQQKIGILSAKLRLYTDTETWNNNYTKPNTLLVQHKYVNTFLTDIATFTYNSTYKLVRAVDLDKNPAYYEIGITKSLKDVVEKNDKNKTYVLRIGDYIPDALTGFLVDQTFNNRAYNPHRMVLVGTDNANEKRAQLRIIYAKKN